MNGPVGRFKKYFTKSKFTASSDKMITANIKLTQQFLLKFEILQPLLMPYTN